MVASSSRYRAAASAPTASAPAQRSLEPRGQVFLLLAVRHQRHAGRQLGLALPQGMARLEQFAEQFGDRTGQLLGKGADRGMRGGRGGGGSRRCRRSARDGPVRAGCDAAGFSACALRSGSLFGHPPAAVDVCTGVRRTPHRPASGRLKSAEQIGQARDGVDLGPHFFWRLLRIQLQMLSR